MPAILLVDRAAVLDPLGQDEARVEDRRGEHDEREGEADQGVRLQGALHDDGAEQVPEQVRAGVAQEDRRRGESMPQVADRRAGHEQCQHAGRMRLQVRLGERDRRERDGGDRAHPRREPVHAIDEVHDVHQRHQPEDRERVGERRAQVHPVDEREREVGHPHAEGDRDHRRQQLANDLEVGRELEQVVGRAHQGDHHGADEDALGLVVVRQDHQRASRDC